MSNAHGITPLRVISIGRFHWIKGYSYAIEAVKLLQLQGIEVEYSIVAPGEVPGEILYQIKDRGLQDIVQIKNGVEHSQIIDLMKSHNVLLLSSVEEGIANVVLEAMAVGLPVVSTDCGGMREVIEDGVTGWLVPVRKPMEMSAALLSVAKTSPEDLNRLTLNAHEVIKQRFGFDQNIREFLSLYSCLERRKQ